jgi:hypothetical protein
MDTAACDSLDWTFWTPCFVTIRCPPKRVNSNSSTSTTGTYSAISLSLPSSANASERDQGSYGETFERYNSEFFYKDAKSICVSKSTYDPDTRIQSELSISASAYGQSFMPSSNFFQYGTDEEWDRSSSKLGNAQIKGFGPGGGCGGGRG